MVSVLTKDKISLVFAEVSSFLEVRIDSKENMHSPWTGDFYVKTSII